ncbi:MAG TPA: cation-efflux pump, partial [Hyphomicrobiales bacterium]|nr:cation-efflux pump [Hyphomicrobiales bacterium]
ATAALAALKLVIGILSGSLGVISGAVDSLMDLAATAVTFFAVRAADRPADADHPYGHGKFESVAAFVECGFLVAAGGWIALAALRRLAGGAPELEMSWLPVAVMGLSLVVDFWRSRSLRRVAAETGSQAIEADALNFTGDMLNSLVVLIGLGVVWLGWPAADAVAALIVSLFIWWAAWRLGRRTFDVLVDTAPAGVAERVTQATAAVAGIASVDQVRVRPTGSGTFAEVLVSVDRALPLERVAAITDEAAAAVRAAVPGIEIAITASPVQAEDETIKTRMLVLAASRRLAIHHLIVQHVGGRLSLSFDIEVDGNLPLAAAHAVASGFEDELRAEFGGAIEVDSHIEPLTPERLDGRDIPAAEREAVAEKLARIARETGDVVRDVHDIRVRSTVGGLVVNFHAVLDPAISVRQAHDAIDAVERGLRRDHPGIARIVGHAEPTR